MALSTQPYKGARDFYPEDKRLQKYIFSVWRRVAERFGYEEYDAPILEPLELYLAKSGEEIVTEQTYLFQDRGGREVVIRPEMTPTVSRMVAGRRQELAYPLRWYSVPNLWRYERPQKGRLREHWQLNVDIFGVDSLAAEHEVILLADRIMHELGAKRKMYTIRLGSRLLTAALLGEYLGLDETQMQTMIRVIDKMHKTEPIKFRGMVEAVLNPGQRDAGVAEKLIDVLEVSSLDGLPPEMAGHESVARLRELANMLADSGVTNAVFDPSLMRGLDYYTDIVFEIFDNHPDNNRAIFGGGRYDGLVGLFGVDPVPTVGFGMGDVALADFLQAHELVPQLEPETDVQVLLIGDVYKEAQKVLQELRYNGINTVVDSSGAKLDKQLKNSLKRRVRYLIFIGEEDLREGKFNLKDTKTGEEKKHSIERLISIISDIRRQKDTRHAGKTADDLLE